MILGDPHALHRDPITGEPTGSPEWTRWDYALVHALQLIEDYSDENGMVIWEKESESVVVEAVRKTDRFEAVKERITGASKYKRSAGEYFVPRLSLVPWEKEWPTFKDWVDEQNKE